MFRTLALAGAAALLAATAAPATAQPRYGPPAGAQPRYGPPAGPAAGERTRDFVTAAAQSDEFERRAGRMAQRMARSRRVRDFAGMMVQDHTKTTEDLQAALRRANRPVPPPPMLTDDQRGMLDQLRNAGADFDATYLQQQVQAHQQAMRLLRDYANNGNNPVIRDAARQTMPLVRRHLRMAEDLQATVRR